MTQLKFLPGTGSLSVMIPGKTTISVYTHPTDNCQIWSIGNFYAILQDAVTLQEFKDVLIAAHATNSKNMLLIDIPNDYVTRLKSRIKKEYIMSETAYTSTRSTLMTIFLIKTTGGAVFADIQ